MQVEDGETTPARDERAEHRILSFEQRGRRGASIRLEAYQRRITHPRPRFENLFDPVLTFVELAQDRVRIDAVSAQARGFELLARSSTRRRLSGWLSYALSSSKDQVGGNAVRRPIDARNVLRSGLDYRIGRGWNLNAIGYLHSGWPTTKVTARSDVDDDGQLVAVPVLGPLYAERLPTFHRLDLRVGREWQLGRGRLVGHLDLRNVYSRRNARGFDRFRFEILDSGDTRVSSQTVRWGGFLPTAGLRWEY